MLCQGKLLQLLLVFLLFSFSLAERSIYREEKEEDKVRYPPEWHLWKTQHGKVYENEREELQRHVVWMANKKHIEEHNRFSDVFGYTLKMNQFGDLTNKEFTDLHMCVQEHHAHNASQLNARHSTDKFRDFKMLKASYNLPETMDWRTAGAVTTIRDQLRCGSSYAFSAAAAIEGVVALTKGDLVRLSPQNIVDCSGSYGNAACACGNINNAFLYVIENGGLETWKDYPYDANQLACQYQSSKCYPGTSITGVVTIPSGNEEKLKAAVANAGPVSTYVDGSSTAFQFYSSGILDYGHCSSSSLSHALLIIGYGSYGGKDYWLLKNSWGPHWGELGYIMMARNQYNQCGVATSASYPTP